MDNYINSTLVHWTGRDKNDENAFEILKKIISSQKIHLSYCPNHATPVDETSTKDNINDKQTMMVCFTDLPLKYSSTFCAKFGTFGIGFKKSKMIEYGANPVFYTTPKHLDRIRNTNSLINKLISEEKDREWKDGNLNEGVGENYQYTGEHLYALNELFGFTQEFSYKDRDENYYQREWRINYETLPLEVGKGAEKVGYGGIHQEIRGKILCEMKFAIEDIDYLILPKSFFKRKNEITEVACIKLLIYEVAVEGKWWKKYI
jgi:hypothetical protein